MSPPADPATSRVRFRPLARTDVQQLHALCIRPHARGFLPDGAAAEVARSERLFAQRGLGLWLLEAVDGPDGSAPIGIAGFRVFDHLGPEPQLLCACPRLATEVASALVAWAHGRGLSRLTAAVDAPDCASARVLEQVGFRPCGRVPGGFGDVLLLERFAGEVPVRIAHPTGTRFRLEVARTWDGAPASPGERATVELELAADELRVRVDAPAHGDPPPGAGGGSTERLWEHEVVELMLLGRDERYLEVELGPAGHYLVLELAGVRRVVHQGRRLHYAVRAAGGTGPGRWCGMARIPLGWLPADCARINAFAIHGTGEARRHLCCSAPGEPGPEPDFHRLDAFADLAASRVR